MPKGPSGRVTRKLSQVLVVAGGERIVCHACGSSGGRGSARSGTGFGSDRRRAASARMSLNASTSSRARLGRCGRGWRSPRATSLGTVDFSQTGAGAPRSERSTRSSRSDTFGTAPAPATAQPVLHTAMWAAAASAVDAASGRLSPSGKLAPAGRAVSRRLHLRRRGSAPRAAVRDHCRREGSRRRPRWLRRRLRRGRS